MTEIARVLDQLDRAWDGEAWHGPPLMAVLDGVGAVHAAARPIAGAHTIAELVAHLTTWKNAVRRRLEGDAYEPPPAEDWPAPEPGEPGWRDALDRLAAAQLALRARIAVLEDSDLERRVAGQAYTTYHLIHGAIQHDLYHAGQIALLRKAGP